MDPIQKIPPELQVPTTVDKIPEIITRAEISKNEQGSEEWYRERLGVLTASRMHRVINGTQKGWQTFYAEMYREVTSPEKVLAEEPIYAEDMEHGKQYEDAARASAELMLEVDIIPIGFAWRYFDAMKIGASVDGIILNPNRTIYATVEIKCFTSLQNHAYVWTNKRILDRYIPQVQTQNLVFEAPRSIFVSYHEDMPEPRARTVIVEVAPDPQYHHALLNRANAFTENFRMYKANGGSLGVLATNHIPQRF